MLLVNGKTPTSSVACDPAIVRLQATPAHKKTRTLACFIEELGGGTHAALRATKHFAGRDTKAEVEPGKVYLVSDNRPMHLDSRDFNTVAPGTCHHIALRLWSAAGWSDAKKRLNVLW